VGAGALGFVTFLASLITVLAGVGMYQVYAPRGHPVQEITVTSTPALIARGEEIANVTCSGCHSLNKEFPLSGGRDIFEDVPVPLARRSLPT
jgi:mono/diheme cytochrome c family protein